MRLDTVKHTLKSVPFGQKWAAKKFYNSVVENELMEREKVLGLTMPYGLANEFLFITNLRVIKYNVNSFFGADSKSIPIKNIVSYNIKNRFLSSDLIVRDMSGYVEIKDVPADIANHLINILSDLTTVSQVK